MEKNNDRVALFDFCETIVSFQTADAFVDYVRNRIESRKMRFLENVRELMIRFKISVYLERFLQLLVGYNGINKKLKLLQLAGLSEEELIVYAQDFYENEIKSNLITDVYEIVKSYIDKGYLVGLVSGGYDVYLKYFVEENELDFLISSQIEICNGKCTGRMKGIDCMAENKPKLLNSFFLRKPDFSIAYSDSISDVPFLNWASEGVVVSQNLHQDWISNYNFKELIWLKKKK